MGEDYTEYRGKNVTFIVTPKKLAVQTSLQFFIIEPAEVYYRKRWTVLRGLIQMGEIQTISDLADYSSGQMLWRISERGRL